MKQRGFTIIELVTVMCILGILALSALSRLNDTQSYTVKAYQDRLMASLRAVQTKAMQDTRPNFCYQLNFTWDGPLAPADDAWGMPTDDYSAGNASVTCGSGIDADATPNISTRPTELKSEELIISTLDGTTQDITYLRFTALGKPVSSAGTCVNTCKISFDALNTTGVCVNQEGLIYAC